MKLDDVKKLAADVKATIGATGPRTEKGKLRAALNSVRHGLSGVQLLLPGEDAATYEARLDALFVALAPTDDAQAQMVALITDDCWKLERLGKIEHGLTLGRMEQLLAQTATAEKAGTTAATLQLLGTALTRWAEQPIPTERTVEFSRRLKLMDEAVDRVAAEEHDFPADLLDACGKHLSALYDGRETAVPAAAYQELYQAAAAIMGRLLEEGDRVEAGQEELRKAIATISVPDREELAKVAKYRRTLEDGLLRRLQALEQLRKLAASAPAVGAQEARAYRVKLRLVG